MDKNDYLKKRIHIETVKETIVEVGKNFPIKNPAII